MPGAPVVTMGAKSAPMGKTLENVHRGQNPPLWKKTHKCLEEKKEIREEVVPSAPSLPRPEKKPAKATDPGIVEEVLSYLNERTGKSFKATTGETRRAITARATEGHSLIDFKRVIDSRVRAWKGDPKMSEYLCPSTLFRPSNFEKYLQAAAPPKDTSRRHVPDIVHCPRCDEPMAEGGRCDGVKGCGYQAPREAVG